MTPEMQQSSPHERLAVIREMLAQRQSISIRELSELFVVSEMTVRRDLAKLEHGGQVRRTHGGAVRAERMVFEFDFAARRRQHQRAKQAIACEALRLIRPGQRIILDTGTTTLELAHLLSDMADITVITPSLAVASMLQFSHGVQTVLLGGTVRRGSPDLAGPLTERNLDQFAADIAFQGADAVGPDGSLYTADTRIVGVDRKIRERAERTYVLADSSKIGKTALIKHGHVSEVAALITDGGIEPDLRKALEDIPTAIIVAGYAEADTEAEEHPSRRTPE